MHLQMHVYISVYKYMDIYNTSKFFKLPIIFEKRYMECSLTRFSQKFSDYIDE